MIRKVVNRFLTWLKTSSGSGLIFQCYGAFHYSALWIIKSLGASAGYYVDSGYFLEIIHTSWLAPIWAMVAIGVFFEISRIGHQGFVVLAKVLVAYLATFFFVFLCFGLGTVFVISIGSLFEGSQNISQSRSEYLFNFSVLVHFFATFALLVFAGIHLREENTE